MMARRFASYLPAIIQSVGSRRPLQ